MLEIRLRLKMKKNVVGKDSMYPAGEIVNVGFIEAMIMIYHEQAEFADDETKTRVKKALATLQEQ